MNWTFVSGVVTALAAGRAAYLPPGWSRAVWVFCAVLQLLVTLMIELSRL